MLRGKDVLFSQEGIRWNRPLTGFGCSSTFSAAIYIVDGILCSSDKRCRGSYYSGCCKLLPHISFSNLNPSQDYLHLKQRRAEIQSQGYLGLIVGSSRAINQSNLVVLFQDQSSNVQSITPHEVEFRLIDEHGKPFHNHATQLLDFTAGEVRFTGTTPSHGAAFKDWQRVAFNH